MFSETPEEMQSEDTAGWASEASFTHTHTVYIQAGIQVTAEMETEKDKERPGWWRAPYPQY